MKLNKNNIEIKFFDFDISHDEISSHLSIQPTNFWVKGDKYEVGPRSKNIIKIRKTNYWGYETFKETEDFIGDQIKEFLEVIIGPRINVIKNLTNKYHGEFSVVQYMYNGCNPGLYFEKNQIKMLNDSGLELNVDIYVLSDKNEINEIKNDTI